MRFASLGAAGAGAGSDEEPVFEVYGIVPRGLGKVLGIDNNCCTGDESLFVDFLQGCLAVDGERRMCAADALKHPFIWNRRFDKLGEDDEEEGEDEEEEHQDEEGSEDEIY